jgi:hypothetical protein
MRDLRGRIGRLEARVGPPKPWEPRTDAEWLAYLEEFGRRGYGRGEPDFPAALAAYRAAVEAGGTADGEHPDEWYWVLEIAHRVTAGKPPVTEAEFYELKAWFLANEARLPLEKGVLLNPHERAYSWKLHYCLNRGPRAFEATEIVECLRTLRAEFERSGEGPQATVSERAS